MTEFLLDTEVGGFLSPPDKLPSQPRGQLSRKRQIQDQRLLEEASQSNTVEPVQMSALAPAASIDLTASLIEDKADLETLQEVENKRQEVQKTLSSVEDITSIDYLMANDPLVGAELYRIQSRQGRAVQVLNDTLEQFSDDGAVGKVLEFIDQFGYDIYTDITRIPDALTGGGTEITELSQEWMSAMRSLDDDEFEAYVAERVDDLTSGILSGTEPDWRVARELAALEAAGEILYDRELGYLVGAVSVADAATLGLTGAVGGWRAGRSLLGRLRSTAGTRTATETAEGHSLVAREAVLDGEVLDDIVKDARNPSFTIADDIEDADFVDDIIPDAMGSNVRPSSSRPKPPPVSSGAIGNRHYRNRFVDQFLKRQSKMSFGTFDPTATASRWATVEAARVARGGTTSLINFDVVEEGISRAKVKFQFGNTTGQPFSDYDSALKASDQVSNSKIIDGRTGIEANPNSPSKQFFVQSEVNAPLRKGIGGIDFDEVYSRWDFGIFSRADIGSSSFLSNLADAGDFGAAGFKKDFEGLVIGVTKLPRKDLRAIDSILTTLRDTPTNGTSRAWLNNSEFTQAYNQMMGVDPSREVIQNYETLVEISDFSWWVMANERLRVLADGEYLIVNTNGVDNLVYKESRLPSTIAGEGDFYAYDLSDNTRVAISTIDDDTPIMALDRPSQNTTHVVNYRGQTRAPELEDAFPYNAGGPRSNPNIQWFVGTEDGSWNTLIGARTQINANKAVEQYNNVVSTLREYMNNNVDNLASLSTQERNVIDTLIKENNEWNPNITNVDEWIEFAQERGVDPFINIVSRERGTKITSIQTINERSMLDLDLQSYVSYSRHDHALIEYGGAKAGNPDPILAIMTQYNNMVHRGAQTQYRMNHPTAWVRALENLPEGKKVQIEGLTGPMSDEMKVKNARIIGNSDVAVKLRAEQQRIIRRLNMMHDSQAPGTTRVTGAASNAMIRAMELTNNWSPQMQDVAFNIKNGMFDETSNLLLKLGFYQNMASPDQAILQSLHAIPLMAISPKNAMKSVQLAAFIRQAARSAPGKGWNKIVDRMALTASVDRTVLDDLLEHILDSGRGYMRGAIAEDPSIGVGLSAISRVGDVISTPYYAGENFSATASRVTAYFDTIDRYPNIDTKSRQFWNAVQERDRTLSFALNNAQKSFVQSDTVIRVPTQWTSYMFRTIENIIAPGSTLTAAERTRLAFATTLLWGVPGLGGAYIYGKSQEATEDSPEWLRQLVLNGIDVINDQMVGVKFSDRVALNPLELIERGMATITGPTTEIPAFNLTGETATAVFNGFANFGSGRWSLLGHDAETLARTFKVVDNVYLAYSMMKEDARRTSSGSVIYQDFTPAQEVFQLIGFSPSEAVDMRSRSNLVFNADQRRKKAIKQAQTPFKRALEFAEQGNYGAALQSIKDADAILRAYDLPETHMAEARETIFSRAGYSRVNWVFQQLMEAGYTREAINLGDEQPQ